MTSTRSPIAPPGMPPELLPLLPIILTIWSDGVLSDEELNAICERLDDARVLPEESRRILLRWLDPDDPPSPDELAAMRGRLRAAPLDPRTAARSLTDLGLALRAAEDAAGPWDDQAAVDWLRELESTLGVLGSEAARKQLGASPAPSAHAPARPTGESAALHAFHDEYREDLRAEVAALLTAPELVLEPGLPSGVYRERVMDAVAFLARRGLGALAYPEEYGGRGDPSGAVAVFETLAYGDLSVLVKYGVQFGLFGGSIHQLGTERHHGTYLARAGTLELPGCYAMTETGHGSNVRDLETTATYDHAARSLIVHTPTERAGKDWIGNAALHGRLATVFARLVVDDVDHGVHAILVPIRSDDGEVLPGVRIEDRGLKAGLNGVDNGRIWFDGVRVPVENLLDRFARIDEDGRYRSPITSSGRRFFTMLRTLVAGRMSIAAASVSASKVALTIAVRYAAGRRQFGPEGGEERPILGYTALQRSLTPRLAQCLGLHFAVRALQRRFAATEQEEDPELEGRAAALKAYASDHCVDTVQACREACGGQGYLAENRFSALKEDTDVFTTFEGANLVLYQLVAKGLLSRYKEEMGDLTFWRAVKTLGERAEISLTELNPVVTRRTDPSHLRDPSFHAAAFDYRESRILRSAALRLRGRLRDGMESFEAVNEVQDHLVSLAKAHAERIVLEAFHEGCARAPTPGMSELLSDAAALFALSRMEADRGWFLESGYLEPQKSKAVREQVTALCREVSECAEHLVDGFGIPEALLPELVRR
ncbi:MAG: acyl-CoA dehydrogenase [Longimicrobiales bacterium]|nr:acyl-CoA dehydrogenase [Longimicrobiales bacterium]